MNSTPDPLQSRAYRDMQLLHEIAQTPYATQRDLAKRIGVALGLTNLMLRRLSVKGFVKVIDEKVSKIRYLITPQGNLEKNRLTVEFIRYSLHLYGGVRRFLREQLSILAQADNRRIVLCGTDELAEIACLTIQEMGLELVGVMEEAPQSKSFLGVPVWEMNQLKDHEYDRLVVVSLQRPEGVIQRLASLGVPSEKILSLFLPNQHEEVIDGAGVADYLSSTGSISFPLRSEATDVVVLCGGRGARLGAITANTPKPLLPIGGHPFLLRLLLRLEQEGFTRIILAAHHLADHFRSFLATYGKVVPEIQLVVEAEPLGTGGAVRHAVEQVRSSSFVAINGDSWVSQPMAPVLAEHSRFGRAFTVVAVQAVNVEGGARHKGIWRVGPQGQVLGFATEESVLEGWVNAGIYVFDRAMVSSWPMGPFSLEENLPALLNGKEAGVFCSAGRLLDIGTPDCYERASRVLESTEEAALISELGGVSDR